MSETLVEASPESDLDFPVDARELMEAVHRTGTEAEVTPQWVLANKHRIRLVDVREAGAMTRCGCLQWAEHIPLGPFLEQANLYDRRVPLIVMCANGRRSGAAVTALETLGFTAVASMQGGIDRWIELGQPTCS